ncbi:uncharacterized protein LOC114244691 [Bombyx mandarina]|uniref:Uncharacterized protein LOC114244691 n=1 Tax=Bombyx mandarina TaxID=7092 RepID=A0A6J2JS40_BOMMA|nr:uncharacterized protein LOC114244691 [Bombyx mandarina]
MIINLVTLSIYLQFTMSAVLDPALYLVPSPPFTEKSPNEKWSRSDDHRIERDTSTESAPASGCVTNKENSEEVMTTSETFWPFVRSVNYGATIHVPLSFSLSGTYGRPAPGSGIISNTYAAISGLAGGVLSKSALAGNGYSAYVPGSGAVRIYGGDNQPSWGGWGNGKWGHYGKG